MLAITSTIKLNNGLKMPLLGLGTWQAPDGETAYHAVRYALEQGYRHIDTARIYRNEASVGKAIRDSGIPREQIWVTTKLFPFYGFNLEKMFADSFRKLGLEYIDLLLVHWPIPGMVKKNWLNLEKIYRQGTVRSLGVSNHSIGQMQDVFDVGTIKPVLNQIKCSPYNYDPKMHAFLAKNNMYLEAYSPLTRGHNLNDSKLVEIAAKYSKSTAQILIRWCLQKDIIVIPKSVHEERIKENADVYNFEISTEDMMALDGFSSK